MRVLAAAAPLAAALVAAPASAVPEGWSDPAPVNGLEALLVYGIAPLAASVVITLLVLLPRFVGAAKSTPALTDPSSEGSLDTLLGGRDEEPRTLDAPAE
jgi:hypothetical protein